MISWVVARRAMCAGRVSTSMTTMIVPTATSRIKRSCRRPRLARNVAPDAPLLSAVVVVGLAVRPGRLCLWRRLGTGLRGVLYLAGRFRHLERLLCVRFPGDPPEDGDWGRFQADPGTERFGCDQSDGGAVVDDSGVCPDISKYSRTTSRKWAGIRIPSGPCSEKPRLPK